MKSELKNQLAAALANETGLEIGQVKQLIEAPKNRDHGDLAFPCFTLAKTKKMAPPQCAAELAAALQLPPGFSSVQPLGPFLNFKYDNGYLIQRVLGDILNKGLSCSSDNSDKSVIVEYSSPNIAKPFHVGHLRSTLIGNCLDRVFRFCRYRTVSINHLGDWGTQFGFVWAGCRLWGKPADASVAELVELYRKATTLREQQEKGSVSEAEKELPDVNAMARDYFIALERGEQYAVEFWQECVSASLQYLKDIYKRLGITFDHYTGESFYSDKLDAVTAEIRAAGLLVESEGALGVQLGDPLGFARISTPDGRSLYLTRDLATAIYRAATFRFDKALYVVGAPQTLHFQQLKGVLEALGKDYADDIIQVPFGHVLGMKTRGQGGFIELNDFLDEAHSRALAAYREQVSKRPEGLDQEEVARAVALGAVIFSNLSRSNIKDVQFNWDHALEFQGDSGPYLLYACARINGIKQRALEEGIDLSPGADLSLLVEPEAAALTKVLADFESTVAKVTEDYEPSHLAAFALTVAKEFSRAYLELKVVGEPPEVARARLALFEATRLTLSKTLELMGITVLERM